MNSVSKYCSTLHFEMTHIIDNIYLGSVSNSNDDFYKKHNISLIINVAIECEYKSLIKQHHYQLYDNYIQDLIKYFDEIVNIMTNNKNNILIHCFAGKSRSVSFVLAFLMKSHNMKLSHAFEYVSKLRDIYPNLLFMQQLMEYEKQTFNLTQSTFDYDEYAIESIRDVCIGVNNITHQHIKTIYESVNKDVDLTIDEIFKQAN